jgi:hypothetical protein
MSLPSGHGSHFARRVSKRFLIIFFGNAAGHTTAALSRHAMAKDARVAIILKDLMKAIVGKIFERGDGTKSPRLARHTAVLAGRAIR